LAEKTNGSLNLVHPMSSMHMTRDEGAVQNLCDIFAGEYRPGGTLLNVPPKVFGLPGPDGDLHELAPPAPVRTLDVDDLVIQATRFPLDDNPEWDPDHALIRGGSSLEMQIGQAVRRVFFHLDRNVAILSDEVAAGCDELGRAYRSVLFSMRSDRRSGRISGYAVRAGNVSQVHFMDRCLELPEQWTIGYIVFIPAIGPGDRGPAFLNVFGLHGTATLLWSTYVRQSLSAEILQMVRDGKPRVEVYRFQPRFEASLPTELTLLTNGQPELLVDVTLPVEGT
jgi:hypothetical protein